MYKKIICLLLLALPLVEVKAQNWQFKQAPLMSRFAKDVDTSNVLPEYPRPQLRRTKWKSLNGLWQYKPGTWQNEPYPKYNLAKRILVPFPVESALSGVMEHHDRLWYRRKFNIPSDWKDQQVLLHFGAVDYECEVFINDKLAGKHQGGYDPFTIDITNLLTPGEQVITIKVWDPTDGGGYPRGKQTLNPQGIMYTSTTGIWQTIWLEPVPKQYIVNVKMTPDIDHSLLNLSVNTNTNNQLYYTAQIKDGNKTIATYSGDAAAPASININQPKLWAPEHPFLYDMTVTLKNAEGKTVDIIETYFGMRKSSIGFDGKYYRMYLNNKPQFQFGPLDQGFWPEGIYTAPTDAALRSDLEMIKNLGFNMVRKHIKVEPQRWYYWADRLGLLVWQDMPSINSYTFNTPAPAAENFSNELVRLIETHYNSPSIITWVIFNENQGQHDTKKYVAMVRGLDKSRIVNEGSGSTNEGVGDLYDIHPYPPPVVPDSKSQANVCGEFGGIGYQPFSKVWNSRDLTQYVTMKTEKDYLDLYDKFATMIANFRNNKGLSAAVYTEITDVEIELNGIMTYDRVLKANLDKIHQSNIKALNQQANEYTYVMLPTAENAPRQWQYTTTNPGKDWMLKNFNAGNWSVANGGFGTEGTPGARIGTTWNTSDIWMRQAFTLKHISSSYINKLKLRVHHDEDCQIYINGVLAANIEGWTADYENIHINDAAKAALNKNGNNVIAIHCTNKNSGQFIDAGLVLVSEKKLNLNADYQ
ncbi:sugar-binding domain-containing protein [Mucilaginibacter sp. CSA2-8R]|uniref:glycoside hydrolase family 2 protein n=1 Tax=Mucilaginibacter sp. CSA2-8R TaxID=3141542 RepID=UPI00315CF227